MSDTPLPETTDPAEERSLSYSPEQIFALIDAMDQVLDDMGAGEGQSVYLYTKAKARIAFEPFLDPECREFVMPLNEAQQIVEEVDGH